MTPTRPLSRRLAVTGGLTGGILAGLAVTAPLLAVAEPQSEALPLPVAAHSDARSHARPVVAHAKSAPSVLSPRPVHRASRSARPAPRTVVRTVPVGRTFHGLASWYGGSFHGRRTANGEVYDANGLTTASRTLPFGTRLRVCHDGRCVVVRVNDRGPFVDSRVLDLSRGASRALGFSGVAHVSATPVATRRVTVHPRPRPVRRHARPVVRQRAVAASEAPKPTVTAPLTPVNAPVSAAVAAPPTAPLPAFDGAASLGLFGAAMAGLSGAGLAGRRQLTELQAHLHARRPGPS